MVGKILGRDDPDIVGNAVSKALMSLDQYKGDAALETWFRSIVLRELGMARRAAKRRGEVSLEEAAGIAVENGNLQRIETDNKVVRLVLNGWTFREIAEKLDVPFREVARQVASFVRGMRKKNG
jgi:DNA-directed RNA polymerase specialized sigma24 family protein